MFKVLESNMTDHRLDNDRDYKFKLGLNVWDNPDIPIFSIEETGFMINGGDLLAFVTIPEDTIVKRGKFHGYTNKVCIEKIIKFSDWEMWNDEKFCLKMCSEHADSLQYIKNQTEAMCLNAVNNCCSGLEYVKNQTSKICETAVSNDGTGLEFVREQTEKLCYLAVKENGLALEFVKKEFKTQNLCFVAVMNKPLALQFVEEELQKEHITHLAVRENCFALEFVVNQTEKLCLMALEKSIETLKFVKLRTKAINDYVISKLHSTIDMVVNFE